VLINMLKATSKMLEIDKNTLAGEPAIAAFTKVQCAKTILDEVIASLENPKSSASHVDVSAPIIPSVVLEKNSATQTLPTPKVMQEPRQEVVVPDGGFMVTVDAQKKLKPIVGLPMESMIELDGKQYKHKDAIGLTFTKARIL
jgi:hypothetical protein